MPQAPAHFAGGFLTEFAREVSKHNAAEAATANPDRTTMRTTKSPANDREPPPPQPPLFKELTSSC